MSKIASGISSMYYAKFDPTTKTYGTPIRIKGLEEVAITENFSEGSNYADNLRNVYIKELAGANLSLTFSNISRAIEADLTGQSYADGEIEFKTTATAPQVAILFEKNYSDESSDRIIYYNCKLTKDNENGQTKTDSFNFVNDTLSGQAIPMSGTVKTKASNGKEVDLTGVLKYVLDSSSLPTGADTNEIKAKYTNFFTKVQFRGAKHSE